MGGKCRAPPQLYLLLVMIASAVLAIHPLPEESSDWCAKDNATRYVVPPSEPVPTQLEPFPNFKCTPMTQEECDAMGLLQIPECIGRSVVDLNLKHPKRQENDKIFRNISLGIPSIRADRAVSFGIWDSYLLMSSVAVGIDFNIIPETTFLTQALEPIRKNIIEFTVYKCHHRCSGKLPAMNLTNLLSFTIKESDPSYNKPLVFRRGDFVRNVRLRLVLVDHCRISLEIEPFTFTNLPDLRLVALEKNLLDYSTHTYDVGGTLATQLKKVHCGCDYAWLRDLYRVNPELVTAKPAGYIYEVCDAVSPAFENKDIFVPVNCAKNVTADERDYDWKKGFFGDAPRLAATYQCAIYTTALLTGLLMF